MCTHVFLVAESLRKSCEHQDLISFERCFTVLTFSANVRFRRV